MVKGVCIELCVQYKVKKGKGEPWYIGNQKRCSKCNIYLKWEGKFCPCCEIQLRTKPKNKQYKKAYRDRQKNKGLCQKCFSSNMPVIVEKETGLTICEFGCKELIKLESTIINENLDKQ